MTTTTLCQLNVLHSLTPAQVQGDLEQLLTDEQPSLFALNEVGPDVAPGVDAFVNLHGWVQYAPSVTSNRLVWNPNVWRPTPVRGHRKLSEHGPTKVDPPTFLIWQGLEHQPSQTRHLVFCTHLTHGYNNPDAPFQAWRDATARQALLRVLGVTANAVVDHPDHTRHHLLGDLNARQELASPWWYPTPVLGSLWAPDAMPKRIDYMMHSRPSADLGLRVLRRYAVSKGIDSDHAAQVKQYAL